MKLFEKIFKKGEQTSAEKTEAALKELDKITEKLMKSNKKMTELLKART